MKKGKPEKPERKFHTVVDVSATVGKDRRTVYRAIKAGKIKAVRLGGSIGISSGELQRICENGF